MDAWPVIWDGREIGVYDIHLNGNKQLLIYDRADHIGLLADNATGELVMDGRLYSPREFIQRMQSAGAGWNSFESVRAKAHYEKAREWHHKADRERNDSYLLSYFLEVKIAASLEVSSPFVDALDIASRFVKSFLDDGWRRDKELS